MLPQSAVRWWEAELYRLKGNSCYSARGTTEERRTRASIVPWTSPVIRRPRHWSCALRQVSPASGSSRAGRPQR
jgi:hypothetical protein